MTFLCSLFTLYSVVRQEYGSGFYHADYATSSYAWAVSLKTTS